MLLGCVLGDTAFDRSKERRKGQTCMSDHCGIGIFGHCEMRSDLSRILSLWKKW